MSEICGNVHPSNPKITCRSTVPNHPNCSGYNPADTHPAWKGWPNPGYVAPRKAQAGAAVRKTLESLAAQMR